MLQMHLVKLSLLVMKNTPGMGNAAVYKLSGGVTWSRIGSELTGSVQGELLTNL